MFSRDFVLFDEFHLQVLVRHDVPKHVHRALRRKLNEREFQLRMLAVVRELFDRHHALQSAKIQFVP